MSAGRGLVIDTCAFKHPTLRNSFPNMQRLMQDIHACVRRPKHVNGGSAQRLPHPQAQACIHPHNRNTLYRVFTKCSLNQQQSCLWALPGRLHFQLIGPMTSEQNEQNDHACKATPILETKTAFRRTPFSGSSAQRNLDGEKFGELRSRSAKL